MKSKAFIQIVGLSAVLAFSASGAFASGSENADLRPVWMSDQATYTQSSAMLYSDGQPNFLAPSLRQEINSNHSVQDVEQQYLDRNRDYQMREQYGIATTVDEGSYVSDVSAMGRSMFQAARLAPLRQYQQGFQQAQSDGSVSRPVAAVGGVVAMGSGTPIPFSLGDGTQGTWAGDLMNEHGEVNLVSPIVNAHIEMNMRAASQDPTQGMDPSGDFERYKVAVNRELPLQVSSSVVYGSSTNSVAATLSRAIYSHISGSVETISPVGTNLTGQPAQLTGNISYGLTF